MPPWPQAAVTTGPRVQAVCFSQHFHFLALGILACVAVVVPVLAPTQSRRQRRRRQLVMTSYP